MVKKKQDPVKPSELSLWDRKHDAFFKKIFLQSSTMREIIGSELGIDPNALRDMDQFSTEYQSSVVSAALHGRGPWKELKSDGVFKAPNNVALSIEHQSTVNLGMSIRIHMYKEAFLEKFKDVPEDKLKFVVVYSGSAPGSPSDTHRKVTRRSVEYLYVDLNEIPASVLEEEGPYGMVIRLGRPDANEISQFHLAADLIKSELPPGTEQDDLMTALVVASANKPHLFGEVLEKVKMNSVVKQNLVEAMPRLQVMATALENRKRLKLHASRREWPEEILPLIEYIEDEKVAELEFRLFDAEDANDWDALLNEAKEYDEAPAFRR
jgi:hypothetical protein